MRKLLLAITSVLCIGTLSLNAQITGSTCININGSNLNNEHTYDIRLAQLGTDIKLTDPEVGSFSISASGGIEIVRVDTTASQVVIKSKKGITKDELFSRWGRGRINVWYSSGNEFDCGYSMGLHVSKNFDLTNGDYDNFFQVNGPSCVAPGDTVVFSVPPLVTMCYTASLDTYTWDLGGLVDANETNVLYWSADKSAVTLVAPDFGDTDFISVVLGSCNNSSHNLLTRSIYGKPAEPIINVPTCWEDSETITLSLDNYDTDVTYTWVLNNDTLATNSTTSSIDVNINDNPLFRAYSEFEVIVYADPIGGSCFGAVRGTNSFYKGIFDGTSISRISGDNEPCFINGQQKTLKIDKIGEQVVWELPQNWTGIGSSAQFSNDITPTVDAENGVITVKSLHSECLNSVTYDAYLKPSVSSITGNELVESGNTYTYTASATGADSYEWIIPGGYTYTPSTSSTIDLTVAGNGQSISPLQVRAIGVGGCEGEFASKIIGVAPTTPTSISFKNVDGTALTCYDINMVNTFIIYTDPIDANHAFEWDLGTWGTITSLDPNDNEITVTTTALYDGTYTVTVNSTTAAGAFSSSDYSDNFTITDNYSLNATNYDSYELLDEATMKFLSDSDTESVLLLNQSPAISNGRELWFINRYGEVQVDTRDRDNPVPFPLTKGYQLEVTYTQSNGCKVYEEVIGGAAAQSAMLKSASINTVDARANALRNEQLDVELFSLYPNPTQNFINIHLSNFDKDVLSSYRISSTSGQLMMRDEINSSNTKINLVNLITGNYIVLVKCGDKTEEKKFVKK